MAPALRLERRFVEVPVAAEPRHDPVMLREILGAMQLRAGAVVVDGTLGLGGHSLEFLKQIAPGGTLVGFDWDESMLAIARERIGEPMDASAILIHSSFEYIAEQLGRLGLLADAILLDLGLNSAQIDDASRGISFREDAPLDMRMSLTTGEPASALLNRWSLDQIEQVLHDLGDERWARAIARVIVERRKEKPLRTTQDLVDCVMAAIPPGARDKRIHPATRTFQAVRIATTGELDLLEEALRDAVTVLKPGGVLAVLSYHSGEDRIVKNVFRELAGDQYQDVYRKPLIPGAEEVARNPRSRSAKLRVLKRNP
jgi:16S rRNA (cytosine1402-N4)-methyltransferase